jgi:hypothetical protein
MRRGFFIGGLAHLDLLGVQLVRFRQATRSTYRKLHVNCATAAVSKAVAERLVEDSGVIQ